MTCVFLSSPYTAPSPAVMEDRARAAGDACAWLSARGCLPVSPIAHWHHPALRHDLPANAAHWARWNREWLRRADALAVLLLDGWRDSQGVAMERAWAHAMGLPEWIIVPEGGGFAWARLEVA